MRQPGEHPPAFVVVRNVSPTIAASLVRDSAASSVFRDPGAHADHPAERPERDSSP
jgi:hypothetical protein